LLHYKKKKKKKTPHDSIPKQVESFLFANN
jgi:hypothetical protein